MEESKGIVMHILVVKFKDEITKEQINQLIKGYANLVNLIQPMKTFQWGKDVSIENLHQGFTHVFESTFESTDGIAEYIAHPAHVEFANLFLPSLEKVVAVDYKPMLIDLDEPITTSKNSDEPTTTSKNSDEPTTTSINSDEPTTNPHE